MVKKKIKTSRILSQELSDSFLSVVGLSEIDNSYRILWVNDKLDNIFPDTQGNICYQVVRNFHQPCIGCPLEKSLVDGKVHTVVVPAKKKDSKNGLSYFRLITIPNQYENNKVKTVIELMIDITDEEREKLEEEKVIQDLFLKLSKFLLNSHVNHIPNILLFSCVSRYGLRYDRARIVSIKQSKEDNSLEIIKCLILEKKNIEEIDERYLDQKKKFKETDFFELIGLKISTCNLVDDELLECYNNIDDVLRSTSVIMKKLYNDKHGIQGLLLLEIPKDSIFVPIKKMQELNLFFSNYEQAFQLNNIRSKYTFAIKQLDEKFIRSGTEEELAIAVPLAIGKAHDLQAINKRMGEFLSDITDFKSGGEKINILRLREESVQNLKEAVKRVKRIMDSLLSVKSLVTTKIENIKLEEVIHEAEICFDDTIIKKKIVFHGSPFNEIKIKCDKSLMMEVFWNLIDNAIKAFIPINRKNKFIEFKYRDLGNRDLIEVIDNASGISPDEIDHIWDRFYSTRAGKGLGLYFVKTVVEKSHKGTIDVQSHWGEGTKFSIYLNK